MSRNSRRILPRTLSTYLVAVRIGSCGSWLKNLKILFMKTDPLTDTFNVGIIVPLPNHYDSDMPQGAWELFETQIGQLFFYRLNK